MQKKTIIFVSVAFCGAAGLATWLILRNGSAIEYRTATAERGDLNITVSATGNPNAVVTVQVGSQVSGLITALYVDFNSKVTKGQLIARIDPASYQSRVDQAQANLDAARANAANAVAGVQKAQAQIEAGNASLVAAQANVTKAQASSDDNRAKADRRAQLAADGLISREELETAQTSYKAAVADQGAFAAQQGGAAGNVKVAQAEFESAKTQLTASQAQVQQFAAARHSAQIDFDYTYIKAPVDGIVVARRVDVGQTVAASLSAPTLFEIAQDLTKMQVDTNVSEADVGHVQVGQTATFTVDAYPGLSFTGAVTSIRKAPINVQNVITYDAVIGVSNPDLKLFPGMTANVKILVNQRAGVLKIPNAALRYRPASDTPAATAPRTGRKAQAAEQAVWVLDQNNQPRAVMVTTRETDGTWTEVTGGNLKAGDRLILSALGGSGAKAAPPPAAQGRRGPGF